MLFLSPKYVHTLNCPAVLLAVLSSAPRLVSQTTAAPALTPPSTAPQIRSGSLKIPAFDVISVKKSANPQMMSGAGLTADGYRVQGMSITLLIMSAYGIPTYQYIIGEPGWTEDARYDIEAKVADSDVAVWQKMDWNRRNFVLQQILTERFKLKAHWEGVDQPIYSLVVTKKGILHESTAPVDGRSPVGLGIRRRGGVRAIEGTGTMAELAKSLGTITGRIGVDNTGMTGRYDIKFDWTPDSGDPSATDEASAPSIFTAVQEQLGLKLVPATGPVQCLVIDHIETPSDN